MKNHTDGALEEKTLLPLTFDFVRVLDLAKGA